MRLISHVRPLAGAGIEISVGRLGLFVHVVRPLAGAGIEIRLFYRLLIIFLFAPSRGRELK